MKIINDACLPFILIKKINIKTKKNPNKLIGPKLLKKMLYFWRLINCNFIFGSFFDDWLNVIPLLGAIAVLL